MRKSLVSLLVSCVAMCPLALPAQQTLADKQEKARLEFRELHRKMQELQVLRAAIAPDEVKALKVGNRFIQEKRIDDGLDVVKRLIDEESWDESLAKMDEVKKDLVQLMNLLMSRDQDLDKLLKELERLQAFDKRLGKLIEEEKKEREDAARTEALEKHLRDLEQAKSQVEALIARQEQLQKQANEAGLQAAPKAAEAMAGDEGALKSDTQKTAEQLAKLEAENKALTEKKSKDADAGNKADAAKPGDAKPGDAKPGDAKPAAKPGEKSDGKPGDKSGKPGDKDGGAKAGKAGSCSGSCSGAAGAMGKAQDKLGQNKPEHALEDMNEALKKLQQAKEALDDLSEQARRELLELPFEQQFRAQEITRVDTDKLSKDMEQPSPSDSAGESKPTPGADNVQKAVPKQKAAAGSLKEFKAGKAKQDQQDAKEELEQAKKKLEEAIAQLRQELQDEVLRALEERFAAMLTKQREYSARTKVTDRLRAEALTAANELPAALRDRCKELGDGEDGLGGEAGDALKLLQEEGTSAVFPEMVEQLRDDLKRIGGKLHALTTGAAVQQDQKDVEELLNMLLESLRRQIAMNDGQGGSCQCNGQPVLVPLSAELKLIQNLQKQVAMNTKRYDQQVPEQTRVTDEAKAEAGSIARRQGRVEGLTRKLADKLNKLDSEAGR